MSVFEPMYYLFLEGGEDGRLGNSQDGVDFSDELHADGESGFGYGAAKLVGRKVSGLGLAK